MPAPPKSDNDCALSEEKDHAHTEKTASVLLEEPLLLDEGEIHENLQENFDEVLCKTSAVVCEGVKDESGENMASRYEVLQEQSQPQQILHEEKVDRRKKKVGRRMKLREKNKKTFQAKIDLPEDMVKAHQAAYAFLNPNISRYEALLHLLDQAAQTHLSLQPMVAMVVMHYDEINQTLEEMATEGEQMLRLHGDHMAWPAILRKAPLRHCAKTSREALGPAEPPHPDLLQQLLQHSTEKMGLVADSVTGLSTTALEEAIDYFGSLSVMLKEKLQAKRTAEGRLKQILMHVEGAAVRKLNPEDAALHSEDSGIGGENESLTGSERHQRHRESCGSTSSKAQSPPNKSPDQVTLNGEEEDEDGDDDDEEEEEEEEEDEEHVSVDQTNRKCSNSFVPSPGQMCITSALKQRQKTLRKEKLLKRPQTADNGSKSKMRHIHLRQSRSLESLPSKVEDTLSLRDNMRKIETAGKCLESERAAGGIGMIKARLRRHSSGGPSLERGPMRASQPSMAFQVFAPQPPGRNAVKRLINTFSQGQDNKSNPGCSSVPTHVRIHRKSRFPMLSSAQPSLVNNGNNNNNRIAGQNRILDRSEDMDMDSLPPPPPEVLMDNSFESTEDCPGDGDEREGLSRGRAAMRKKGGASQRLQMSVRSMMALPNRGSIRQGCLRQDVVVGLHEDQPHGADPEMVEAETLYRQSRKIIHLRDAAASPAKKKQDNFQRSLASQGAGSRQGSHDTAEGDSLAPRPCNVPPTTPPVSRARLPPSSSSVYHSLPNQNFSSGGQFTTPSSPTSQRWMNEENVPILTSVSFASARSVFCQDSQSTLQNRTPSCTSTLPRPWGESSRGRLLTSRTPQAFIKRGSSGNREPSDQTCNDAVREEPAEHKTPTEMTESSPMTEEV
ncbi:photoreceptor cilium actin regulator isoform X2 [Denticeps clupeoides]|nr:photoreceptor cilium actin regulator-like isoform X2 [Denticeps clupeoides]